MENNVPKVLLITQELDRIRRELKFTRKDFSLLFNVSPYTVDAWCKRSIHPTASNVLQIDNFIQEIQKIHPAFALLIVPDRYKHNSSPVKIQAMVKHYCKNNRLDLISYVTATESDLFDKESVANLVDLHLISSQGIADFVIYTKSRYLPDIFLKELRDSGIKVFHNIMQRNFKIES
jgi:hypothetical protein